jgi:HlyD family secretion protein
LHIVSVQCILMTEKSLINRMNMQANPALPLRDNGIAVSKATASGPGRLGWLVRLKLWRLPLVLAVLFAGAVIGIYFQPPALKAFLDMTGLQPGAGSSIPVAVPAPALHVVASPPPVTAVSALGRLMPEGDVVIVAPPFGAGDARLARLLVAEGDRVTTGQVIAELDSLPQLVNALGSARANLAAVEAVLVQTRFSVASALSEAQANRDRAVSAAVLARAEAARQSELHERGVISHARLEQAESAAIQAERELDRAEALLARQAGGEDQPDVAVATRQVEVARAELDRAEGDIAKGVVVAPQDGTVIALHLRPGERPGQQGIATIGATDRMQAELEVYQTDFGRIAPGQRVALTSPALTGELTGTVARIGLEVGRQTVLASNPAANTDARVVRVIVSLDPDLSERAAALTGLEVTARIDVTEP